MAKKERFNPRPSLLAGETRDEDIVKAALMFQSTPVITGGRNSTAKVVHTLWDCFNPRPSLLAGETAIPNTSAWVPAVSIHARHYWRAKLQKLS